MSVIRAAMDSDQCSVTLTMVQCAEDPHLSHTDIITLLNPASPDIYNRHSFVQSKFYAVSGVRGPQFPINASRSYFWCRRRKCPSRGWSIPDTRDDTHTITLNNHKFVKSLIFIKSAQFMSVGGSTQVIGLRSPC